MPSETAGRSRLRPAPQDFPIAPRDASPGIELREREGWKRNVLATRAGIACSNLRLLEDGSHEPSPSTMLALVRVFRFCSIEELIGGPLGTRILPELDGSGDGPPSHRVTLGFS